MTSKAQYVLSELCGETGIGKKKMQKLVYLLERKGLDLGMRYCIHFYGPYSSSLNEGIYSLQSQGVLDINTRNATHIISSATKASENPLTPDEIRILREVSDRFGAMSALDLELLTTTDYVATHVLDRSACTRKKIVDTVLDIKGSKFDKSKIELCIETLHTNGFLPVLH